MMTVKIVDWKLLIKIVWNLELWYQDNFRKLSNLKRKQIRHKIDNLTLYAEKMKHFQKTEGDSE